MKNVEELKQRIVKHSKDCPREGFVCIGNGETNSLDGKFGINPTNIWSMNIGIAKFERGWYGSMEHKLYYLSKEFCKENGLLQSEYPSLEEQFNRAKELLEKFNSGEWDLRFGDDTLSDFKWNVRGVKNDLVSSGKVNDAVNEHNLKFIVVAEWGGSSVVPIMEVKSIKKNRTKEVKLNSQYTALVSKEEIKVGCQTFPLSIVQELATAIKELQ